MLLRRSVGWLNLMGQVAGVASTAFGLAQMILAAVIFPFHRQARVQHTLTDSSNLIGLSVNIEPS